MNTAFQDSMKQQLEQEQQELMQELDGMSKKDTGDHASGERVPTFPSYGRDNLGENTNSPHEVEDFLERVDATGHLQTQLIAVTHALQRIEEGIYEVCESCGAQIGKERLEANPAAAECISCAQSHT